MQRLLGACLIAAVVGWPATLASAATGGLPAPTGLSAAAAGSSQISLAWTAPVAVKGAPVIGYRIYAGTSSGGETAAGSARVTSDTVSGLSSGTTYYFEVTAVYQSCIDSCSEFESSPSNEVSATTDNIVLGAPTGLTATAAGRSQISLAWTAPVAVKGAPVIGYRIYAGTSSGHESLAGRATVTSGTMSGLSSGTTYYFQVAAVYRSCIRTCSDVESSRSSEVSATTDRAVPELKPQAIQFGRLARHVAGVRFTVLASASSGLEVLLVSGTPRVCSVSGSEVTTVKPGRCRITASQGGNADYSPAPDKTRSFRVERASARLRRQAIVFSRPADVATRRPVKLSASASSGLPVSFRSDTPRVCLVSGSEVTTVKPGRCTITAVQGGNARYAPAPDQTRSFQVGPVASRAPGALVGALAAVVLAAMAGAVLVLRYWPRLRPRPRPPVGPSVRAEPHADSPSTVRLRVTRTHVTSTVRIEPHPAQVSSQLERAQR